MKIIIIITKRKKSNVPKMSAKRGADERESNRINGMQWFEGTFRIPPNYSQSNTHFFN